RGLVEVRGEERVLRFADGQSRRYQAVISTIPLPTLVAMTRDVPAAVRKAAAELLWTSIRCVNLGIERPDVGPGHWVYFYDESIPFFRVSFPSKLAPSNAPAGCSSISCEIAYSRRRPLDERHLHERSIEALTRTGILRPTDKIILRDQIDIPFAYVVFDFARADSVRLIHDWMRTIGIYPCGRFGEWGYHWSFESIESGRRVAAEVAGALDSKTIEKAS
ncbi:MAG: hypothetical protein ACREQ9_11900, partial [Candidatus Binatia bacterium]